VALTRRPESCLAQTHETIHGITALVSTATPGVPPETAYFDLLAQFSGRNVWLLVKAKEKSPRAAQAQAEQVLSSVRPCLVIDESFPALDEPGRGSRAPGGSADDRHHRWGRD
jgi:hypothetical protein